MTGDPMLKGFARVDLTEAKFSDFLNRVHALNTWSAVDSTVRWTDESGLIVAIGSYNNAAPSVVYYIRDNYVTMATGG